MNVRSGHFPHVMARLNTPRERPRPSASIGCSFEAGLYERTTNAGNERRRTLIGSPYRPNHPPSAACDIIPTRKRAVALGHFAER
jgi:hypothetical protein